MVILRNLSHYDWSDPFTIYYNVLYSNAILIVSLAYIILLELAIKYCTKLHFFLIYSVSSFTLFSALFSKHHMKMLLEILMKSRESGCFNFRV
jgi:hypothetical protein